MEGIFDQIALFLPKYLSATETRQLYEELQSFPENKNFYMPTDALAADLLQGDGWRGFIAIDFLTSDRRTVSGVILSNSCDIAPGNRRSLPVSILFAPLVSLGRYEQSLKDAGKADTQVTNTLTAIRSQKVTSIFYLPSAPYGPAESMILLDDIHSQPLQHFLSNERDLLFRLNQYGFYILLIKLSIHFSRFQEGVTRLSA